MFWHHCRHRLTFLERLQGLGGQPVAPQLAQLHKVGRPVVVTEHWEHELRREGATHQLGDVPQQLQPVWLVKSARRVGQAITGKGDSKL